MKLLISCRCLWELSIRESTFGDFFAYKLICQVVTFKALDNSHLTDTTNCEGLGLELCLIQVFWVFFESSIVFISLQLLSSPVSCFGEDLE